MLIYELASKFQLEQHCVLYTQKNISYPTIHCIFWYFTANLVYLLNNSQHNPVRWCKINILLCIFSVSSNTYTAAPHALIKYSLTSRHLFNIFGKDCPLPALCCITVWGKAVRFPAWEYLYDWGFLSKMASCTIFCPRERKKREAE